MQFRPNFIWLLIWASVQLWIHAPANGQAPLRLVNSETQVRKVSFNFPEKPVTFEPDVLQEQIVTRAPTFWERLGKINPFTRGKSFPFDPIELQKDVVRLRQYYQRNGFPAPRVSYSASQLDTASNRIHVIFAVWEGKPLFIQDIRINGADGAYVADQVAPAFRNQWIRFRDGIVQGAGERYTEIERIRIQDQILGWFQNNGYAFVQVDASAVIDTLRRTVDLSFLVDSGKQGYVSSIAIEGNNTVSNKVVLRELPFSVGDRFSSRQLREGQQQLFGLNLFRVALADVPEQPRDSTIEVRIRVNEAKRRYITAETGYARQEGLTFEGEWLNRNFLGGARNLTVGLRSNTGLLGTNGGFNAENVVGKLPARLFRTTVSLRQPYLYTTRLSGIFSPFIEFQNDPQLAASNEFLDINRREFGLNATLIYDVLPFRTVSLQYTLSKSLSRSDENLSSVVQARDIYSKSILGFSSTFGRVDNYLAPKRGVLARPFLEFAGQVVSSGVQYNKTGIELVGYLPLTRRLTLSGRLFGGTLWTFGDSKQALEDRMCATTLDTAVVSEDCLIYENRFDPIFFYAGGGSDVRGWNFQLLGPKVARADTVLVNGVPDLDENGNPQFQNFYYERLGGTTKLIGNMEARSRIPGLGSNWQGAVFFDIGQVANGRLALKDFQYATGLGLRYQTIVGFIRLDVAYKLNPSSADLTDPQDAFLFDKGLITEPPESRFIRRFGLHISIGQAF